MCIHETREERFLGRRDDRDLPAAPAGSAAAAVAAGAAGTTGTPGTAGSTVGTRDARRTIGATRPTRAARFDDEPIGRRHGARVGEQVEGRRLLDFDPGDEQPVIEWRSQNPEPHGHLRSTRASARAAETEGVLEAGVVGCHDGGRRYAGLGFEGHRQPEARDRGSERIAVRAPAAAFERRRFGARAGQKHDVQARRIVLVVPRLERNKRPVVQHCGVDRAETLAGARPHARGHPDLADLLDESWIGRE